MPEFEILVEKETVYAVEADTIEEAISIIRGWTNGEDVTDPAITEVWAEVTSINETPF